MTSPEHFDLIYKRVVFVIETEFRIKHSILIEYYSRNELRRTDKLYCAGFIIDIGMQTKLAIKRLICLVAGYWM